jgi:8-oxo-dGTP pyrophosphatase MutT (NUDIX family)
MKIQMEMEAEIKKEGSVAIIERSGRLLTITRSQTVIAPGKVCFPGGGIESGETPEQALIRECIEELGTAVEPVREIAVSVTPWNIRLHWFTATLPENAALQPNPQEVAAIQWLTPEEILAHPDLLESNLPILKQIFTDVRINLTSQ